MKRTNETWKWNEGPSGEVEGNGDGMETGKKAQVQGSACLCHSQTVKSRSVRSVFLNWSKSYKIGPDNDPMVKIGVS